MSNEHDPLKIQEKINAGLTREQAIQVLDRQAEQEAALTKKTRKPARPNKSDQSDRSG